MLNLLIIHDARSANGVRSLSPLDLVPLLRKASPESDPSAALRLMQEADMVILLGHAAASPTLGVLLKDRGADQQDLEINQVVIGT